MSYDIIDIGDLLQDARTPTTKILCGRAEKYGIFHFIPPCHIILVSLNPKFKCKLII
jgi:hypothetical protein